MIRHSNEHSAFTIQMEGRVANIGEVEIDEETDNITVFGGWNHKEFGPWSPSLHRK